MFRSRLFLAVGLLAILSLGVTTLVAASSTTGSTQANQARSPEATQAREKFAKLLIPEGSAKSSSKSALKRRIPVVNAFGSGPGTAANPGRGRGPR